MHQHAETHAINSTRRTASPVLAPCAQKTRCYFSSTDSSLRSRPLPQLPHRSEIPQAKLKRRAHLIWDEVGPRATLPTRAKRHCCEVPCLPARRSRDHLAKMATACALGASHIGSLSGHAPPSVALSAGLQSAHEPGRARLRPWWQGCPKRVLIVKKHYSKAASEAMRQIADWCALSTPQRTAGSAGACCSLLPYQCHRKQPAPRSHRAPCARRLKAQGLEVVVEEKVHQREFPDLIPFAKRPSAGTATTVRVTPMHAPAGAANNRSCGTWAKITARRRCATASAADCSAAMPQASSACAAVPQASTAAS